MIQQLRQRFFTVQYPYTSPADVQRANLLLYTNWLIGLMVMIAILATLWLSLGSGSLSPNIGLLLAFIPIVPATFVLLQRGRLMTASIILPGLLLFMVAILTVRLFPALSSLGVVLPLLMIAFLFNWRVLLGALVVVIGAGVYGAILRGEYIVNGADTLPGALVSYVILCIALSLLSLVYSNRLASLTTSILLELSRVSQMSALLSASSTDEQIDTLINRVLEIVVTDMNYAFVRVYLLDHTGDNVVALYTRGGVERAGKTPLPLPSGSALQEAVQTRQAVRVDLKDDEVRYSHFLGGSASGLTVPLIIGEEVVGLLDVQSVLSSSFGVRDQETLKLLGLQLSVSLANLRLIEALRQEVKDEHEIVLRQRDRLRQFERADQQAILNAWTGYMQQRGENVVGFDMDETSVTLTPAADLPDAMREALTRGEIITETLDNAQRVSVPVTLRGQVLGVVSFMLPANRPLTRRQTEMILSVVQRMALALDNKRLFEQSQAQARRESKASEIAGLLITSTSVETVLELAARSFNEALGAIQTRIHVAENTELLPQGEEAP